MGREALVYARAGTEAGETKALLESGELILRGGIRRRFPKSAIEDLRVDGDALAFRCAGEEVRLDLGGRAAEAWRQVMITPPPTLRAKLGIGADKRAVVVGTVADPELARALEDAIVEDISEAGVVIACVEEVQNLEEAVRIHARRPALPLWVVHRKGRGVAVGDSAIRARLKPEGFRDSKCCAVSDVYTAARYIRRPFTSTPPRRAGQGGEVRGLQNSRDPSDQRGSAASQGAGSLRPNLGLVAAAMLLTSTQALAAVTIEPNGPVPTGEPPKIKVSGLQPGETVSVHALRRFSRWQPNEKGQWIEVFVPLHAWVEGAADSGGTINLETFRPSAGTYDRADGRGLLWSMRRPGDPLLVRARIAGSQNVPADGSTRLVVTRGEAVLAETSLRYVEPRGLDVETVAVGAVNGVFARPSGKRSLPTLILLHGSEGGSREGARAMATRFAGQGLAAFALNYFAWDTPAGLSGLRNYHVNQPIEVIGDVRNWLATRPEADVNRLGVYGQSKGAEYAEVAAVRYPWIRAVAACVPTDVVWEGYGIDDQRNRTRQIERPAAMSSWSWKGRPLPYIPLRPYPPPPGVTYFTNTERYELSRADHPRAAAAAAIPLERASARFLLLGAGKDEVWASGKMAETLARRMTKAGRKGRVDLKLFPRAGHQICGDGTFPTRLYSEESPDPSSKDLTAEGEASVDSWEAVRAFFRRML